MPVGFLQHVLQCHVQRDERDRPAGSENHCGRFGVVSDVRFGDRRDVARRQGGAAHDGDVRDASHQRRIDVQRASEVGQRPDGDDPQRAGVLVGEAQQQVNGGA